MLLTNCSFVVVGFIVLLCIVYVYVFENFVISMSDGFLFGCSDDVVFVCLHVILMLMLWDSRMLQRRHM